MVTANGQVSLLGKLQSQLRAVAHPWQDLVGVMVMEPLLEESGLKFLSGKVQDDRMLSRDFSELTVLFSFVGHNSLG